MAFLRFSEAANPGKKTKRWAIYSSNDSLLGWIEFYAPWRKYIWSMNGGVIFDVKCTEEVVQFLKDHAEDRNV